MIDEGIGQEHGPVLQAHVEHTFLGQKLRHMAAEAAHGTLFDGDERLMVAGQLQDQVAVERLGETGVGDGGCDALLRQCLGRLAHFLQAGAEVQDGDAVALCDHAAAPDLKHLAALGQIHAHPFAARKAESAGAFVIGKCGA